MFVFVILALLCVALWAAPAAAYLRQEPIYVVRVWPRAWPINQMTFYPKFQPALALASNFYLREGDVGQRFIHALAVIDVDCSTGGNLKPAELLVGARYAFKPKRAYRTLLVFPHCSALQFAGEAWYGYFAYVQQGDAAETVEQFAFKIAHELGHLYGAGHALGPRAQPYWNPLSVMGAPAAPDGTPSALTPARRLTIVERSAVNYKRVVPIALKKWTTTNARWVVSPLTTLWVEFRAKEVYVYATTPKWFNYLTLVFNATGRFDFDGVSPFKDATRFSLLVRPGNASLAVENTL